jgi:hypothetical protein
MRSEPQVARWMAGSGGGQQAAAGQQPAAVLGGGTRRKFAGGRQNALSDTKQNGKGNKINRGARGFHRATRRGRRGAGGGDRRRGRSSDSASLGAAVYMRGGAPGSGAVWRGARGCLL